MAISMNRVQEQHGVRMHELGASLFRHYPFSSFDAGYLNQFDGGEFLGPASLEGVLGLRTNQ